MRNVEYNFCSLPDLFCSTGASTGDPELMRRREGAGPGDVQPRDDALQASAGDGRGGQWQASATGHTARCERVRLRRQAVTLDADVLSREVRLENNLQSGVYMQSVK